MSLAIVTAAGSAGQVLGPPLAEGLLALMPWQNVFLAFAALILTVLLVLPWMRSPAPASRAELQQDMGAAVLGALRDPSFVLIFLGFFSCGYQLAFITAHFPAFVAEVCGPICSAACCTRWGSRRPAPWAPSRSRSSGSSTSRGRWRRAGPGSATPRSTCLLEIYIGRTLISAGSS